MNYEELIEYLDIEGGHEFKYFEVMADLIECNDEVELEDLYQLFEAADNEMISDLLGDYFEDTLGGLPDDSSELYILLEQIKMCLQGMILSAEDDSALRQFVDEFYKFRNWYSLDSCVELLPENGGQVLYQTIRDAIVTSRVEKLGGDKFRYNFNDALNYEIDSYTMTFSEMMIAGEE